MTDHLFHEINEEVRREKLKQLWAKYGSYGIVLAVVFVLAIAGWRGYEWWQSKKAQEAGTAFEVATTLAEQGKLEEARAAFQKLAAEGTAGYAHLARLREAGTLAQNDPKAALAAFDELSKNASLSSTLQDLAAIRAGFLAIDIESPDQVRARLEPLADPGATYRHSARELLALNAWRANDSAGLKKWSEAIAADAETPPTIRARVEMLTVLAGVEAKS